MAGDQSAASAKIRVRLPLARAVRDCWRCLPDLLLYDVLFKIIAFIVLTPCLAWLFRQFIATTGDAAVGNFDIARFLLTPLGLSATVLLGGLVCVVWFMEFAGLMYIGYGALLDRRVTYVAALRFVSSRTVSILMVSFRALLLLGLAVAPFPLIAVVAGRLLLGEHDINYYLAVQPREFQAAIAIAYLLAGVAFAALATVSVPLVFALPASLFGQQTSRDAFRQSRDLVRGRFWQIALAIVGWLLFWGIISALVNLAVYGLGWLMVNAAGQRLGILLLALGVSAAISTLVNAALSFAMVTVSCVLVAQAYGESCRHNGLDVVALEESVHPLGDKPRWRVSKKSPIAIAAAALVIAGVGVQQLLDTLRLDDNVEIAAHRGSSLEAPENTLSAVKRAIAEGATHVEVDVQRTADGQLVVAHDADLMRVGRSPLVITDSKLADLRQVDVGSYLAAEFAGERVPTLDEVIDATQGRVTLIVELKSYASDPRQLAADVVRELQAREALADAVVMSLEYGELQEVRRLDPKITIGYATSAALGDISQLDVDFLAVSRGQATDVLIGTAHAQHKEVFVWTIDQPRQMETMIDRGVDCILTNTPATLVEVLRQRANLSTVDRILLRFRSLYLD